MILCFLIAQICWSVLMYYIEVLYSLLRIVSSKPEIKRVDRIYLNVKIFSRQAGTL